MNAASHGLRHIEWSPYAEDTEEKYEILREKLREADYVIYSSNRLYGSVAKLSERYPMTVRYYRLMFDEKLGFVNTADFTTPPRLAGVSFPDQGADESWTLYDHPRVSIFAKERELSDDEFDALLGGSWEGRGSAAAGRDVSSQFINGNPGSLCRLPALAGSATLQRNGAVKYRTTTGDISLRGLALGQGEEQMSWQGTLNLELKRALWMVMLWQVKPGLTADFAISLSSVRC